MYATHKHKAFSFPQLNKQRSGIWTYPVASNATLGITRGLAWNDNISLPPSMWYTRCGWGGVSTISHCVAYLLTINSASSIFDNRYTRTVDMFLKWTVWLNKSTILDTLMKTLFFHWAACTLDFPLLYNTWWRHQMGILSALLALCARNSRSLVNSPHKGQWWWA